MKEQRARGHRTAGTDPRLAGGPKRPKPGAGRTGPVTHGVVLAIPLKELGYDPRNRKSENIMEDPRTHSLAKSMKRMGQVQAARAVSRERYLAQWPQYAKDVTTPWVLVVGNRRRAAAEINHMADVAEDPKAEEKEPTLDVVPTEETDPRKLSAIPIHENIHRKDLNPMDVARWLAEELPEYGSQEALAEACGRTQAWVSQLLSLLDLIPELQEVVEDEEITATIARNVIKACGKASDDDGADRQRDLLRQASELDDEARADFWASFGRKAPKKPAPVDDDHKPFIEPDGEGDQPGERPRSIVIRFRGAWSAPTVVKTLRDTLSEEQWTELVEEITAASA